MKISNNKAVSIDYTLKDAEGQTLDSSIGKNPLSYVHGSATIIPGLEKALDGKSKGDSFSITIEPKDAYGDYIKELEMTLTKDYFKDIKNLEAGQLFQVQTEQGLQTFSIISIEGEEVKINGNHPLAGMTLYFDIEVKEVRDATNEEIEHGHVHSHGHSH